MLSEADKVYIQQNKTMPIDEIAKNVQQPVMLVEEFIKTLPKDPKVNLSKNGMTMLTQQTSERIEELNRINKDNQIKATPEWMFRPR